MTDIPTYPTSGQTALLLGASGAVGSEILSALLSQPDFTSIHSFVRKPSSNPPTGPGSERLFEHVVDFEKLCKGDAESMEEFKKVKADSVLIALGTTRATAGGARPFERIDREYVLAAAKAARCNEKESQKVIYCSAQMADSSSRFLYPKSKGLTEEGLASLGYSDTVLFRPGFLYGAQRAQSRRSEHLYGLFTHHLLSRVTDHAEIPTSILGKCMVEAAKIGAEGLKEKGLGVQPAWAKGEEGGKIVVINNAQALEMSRTVLGEH